MKKLFVFDLDGTLLNTLSSITYYLNLTLAAHSLGVVSERECKYFVGDGARQLIERALRHFGIVDADMTERLLLEYTASYHADPDYLTEAYDGIIDTVRVLRDADSAIAILSNKPQVAVQALAQHYFPALIDRAYGAREGVALKPAPDSLLALIDEMGAQKAQVVYVGDTAVDMQTARNAGVGRAIGVSWGFRDEQELWQSGADRVIAHPCELISEVERV